MVAGSMVARMVMISAGCGAEMGVATVSLRSKIGATKKVPVGSIHRGSERRGAFELFDLHRSDGKEMREASQFRRSRRADLFCQGATSALTKGGEDR